MPQCFFQARPLVGDSALKNHSLVNKDVSLGQGPPKSKPSYRSAEAMHTFMTTPLIKKLNIWGLGFLCPPCSWTCAPREKYQALLVWSLPSVWVASCSSEGTHTDNHIPFQISNARRNNTLRRRIRRRANKLAPPFKVGPAT